MAEEVEVVAEGQPEEDSERSSVDEPGKLLRIAVMLREMQEEVRRAPTDDAGRERLKVVYDRAVSQLVEAVSGDLREELTTLNLTFDKDSTPSESEILIAQAQLIGWLEGLFQGIQMAIVNQQLQARQQLEQIRGRGLTGGQRILPGGADPNQPAQQPPGQYL